MWRQRGSCVGRKQAFTLGSLAHTPPGAGAPSTHLARQVCASLTKKKTVICIHTDDCRRHLVAKGCRDKEEMAFMGMTGNKLPDGQLAFELGSKHELALCCPKESWQG